MESSTRSHAFDPRSPRRAHNGVQALLLFLGIVGTAVGILTISLALDAGRSSTSLLGLLESLWASEGGGLGSLPEVLAAVLGLSLTVVAIVVQLAAQRYAPSIVDLFMRDLVNIGVFSFMVVSCIYVLLVSSFSVGDSMPRTAMMAGLVIAVVNFGILLPYFAHVFRFLRPHNIVRAIEAAALKALAGAPREEGGRAAEIRHAQDSLAEAVERITDICIGSIDQSDRAIALRGIRSLETLARSYLEGRDHLPAAWFDVEPSRFAGRSEDFVAELLTEKTWFEARILLAYEQVLSRSLGTMNDLVGQVALSTRVLGSTALRRGEQASLELIFRFFNTYLRGILNARQARAAYSLLDHYRALTTELLPDHPSVFWRAAEYLVYYGRVANGMGIAIVTITVAHDLRLLCQLAYESGYERLEALVQLLLSLDQSPEGKSEEAALLGVRTVQTILGGYFLARGELAMAELIQDDMQEESKALMRTVSHKLLTMNEPRFWEITDRGLNFEYVEPELKPHVEAFLEPLLA